MPPRRPPKIIDNRKLDYETRMEALKAAGALLPARKMLPSPEAEPPQEKPAGDKEKTRAMSDMEAKRIFWKAVDDMVGVYLKNPSMLKRVKEMDSKDAQEIAEAFGGKSHFRNTAGVAIEWKFNERGQPYTVSQFHEVFTHLCRFFRLGKS
ncbi:hypothetical protein GF318_05620 [Candidatus Micrarchaeota archaeon]|nr:hypothetical protein [Candidatus Micrarchaeota archaeon]